MQFNKTSLFIDLIMVTGTILLFTIIVEIIRIENEFKNLSSVSAIANNWSLGPIIDVKRTLNDEKQECPKEYDIVTNVEDVNLDIFRI